MDPSITPLGEFRQCLKCGFETNEKIVACPKCEKPMSTESELRTSGQLLMVLGGLGAAFIAVVGIGVAGVFVNGLYFANTATRQNFATREADVMIIATFAFIGSILTFFLSFYYEGRHRRLNGRRHPSAMKYGMWLLAAGFAIITIAQILVG